MPKESESLPLVVYFLSSLDQQGLEIENKFKIIEKIISLFFNKEYINIISVKKIQHKDIRCSATIG